MRIIRNNFLPPKGFTAINLFGVIFARKNAKLSDRLLRHEAIHTAQMKERFYIFFYLLYFFEWVVLMLRYLNLKRAYHAVSFEREAYENENNENYLKERSK
jgi:hypothetical protein